MGACQSGIRRQAPAFEGLTALYHAELHELHSAEQQLGALADEVWVSVRNGPLAERLSDYAAALRVREAELGNMLSCDRSQCRVSVRMK